MPCSHSLKSAPSFRSTRSLVRPRDLAHNKLADAFSHVLADSQACGSRSSALKERLDHFCIYSLCCADWNNASSLMHASPARLRLFSARATTAVQRQLPTDRSCKWSIDIENSQQIRDVVVFLTQVLCLGHSTTIHCSRADVCKNTAIYMLVKETCIHPEYTSLHGK